MKQTAVPFLFVRGGTSRGPYFLRSDLPEDQETLSDVLIAVVGAGNPRNIDGLGGGNAVTTKVAMLSRSDDPEADVDYFFAQVAVEKRLVDYAPTCGNILVGVGPAAIEMGLVPIAGDETRVRIRGVNTGALVEAIVQTPDGAVRYDGDLAIDGVPGTAAPIALNFMEVVGSRTGAMLPTGQVRENIDGFEVTCIDVAMPMMIAQAADFGITGLMRVRRSLMRISPCSNGWRPFASKPGAVWDSATSPKVLRRRSAWSPNRVAMVISRRAISCPGPRTRPWR